MRCEIPFYFSRMNVDVVRFFVSFITLKYPLTHWTRYVERWWQFKRKRNEIQIVFISSEFMFDWSSKATTTTTISTWNIWFAVYCKCTNKLLLLSCNFLAETVHWISNEYVTNPNNRAHKISSMMYVCIRCAIWVYCMNFLWKHTQFDDVFVMIRLLNLLNGNDNNLCWNL